MTGLAWSSDVCRGVGTGLVSIELVSGFLPNMCYDSGHVTGLDFWSGAVHFNYYWFRGEGLTHVSSIKLKIICLCVHAHRHVYMCYLDVNVQTCRIISGKGVELVERVILKENSNILFTFISILKK